MKPPYVIITAVRNEAEHLTGTIASVLRQTVLPSRWVIVSNGSTDATDEIIVSAAERNPFIEFLRVDDSGGRDYAAKVQAYRAGYERVKNLDFEYLGNLDGDITLPPNYYGSVLTRFTERPRLGIAGGAYVEKVNGHYRSDRMISMYPPGAAQVFRRTCYEEIGGYLPLAAGGEDSAAAVMARMAGWEATLLPDIRVVHQRVWGSGGDTDILRGRRLQGRMDYHLGMHPIFAFAKAAARLTERPRFIGSCARLAGFLTALMHGEERQVSREFIEFVRAEQMRRLWPLAAKRETLPPSREWTGAK